MRAILAEVSSRIELLQQILSSDPSSKLARYALAMERINRGEWAQAMEEFAAVLVADPSYGAAYYHGGQTLEKMGQLDQAREFYRRGIAASGDAHTRSELEAALSILGD
jgi:tetratricopeptide (TPR) repeat protein